MNNIDFYFTLTILFLIVVLIDLVLPVVFGQPSFSYTATLLSSAYNSWLRPLIKWVLIEWYTLQYKLLNREIRIYIEMFTESPNSAKPMWRVEIKKALIRRASVHDKLCEVRNVQ